MPPGHLGSRSIFVECTVCSIRLLCFSSASVMLLMHKDTKGGSTETQTHLITNMHTLLSNCNSSDFSQRKQELTHTCHTRQKRSQKKPCSQVHLGISKRSSYTGNKLGYKREIQKRDRQKARH